MLDVRCAACKAPLPIDRVHALAHGDAFCSASGTTAGQGRPTIAAGRRRPEALALIARARRANQEVTAVDALWLDRRAAADAIIGISKSARARKRSLSREGDEYEERTEAARKRLEGALAPLMGHVMALAEETPAAVELAVKLARGFPAIAGERQTDADLATLEGMLAGTETPPPLRIDAVEEIDRAERHRDGVCLYESERFEAKSGSVWLEKSFAGWSGFSLVEWIDGDVKLRDASGETLISVYASEPAKRDRVFGWVREARPELRDAQRTMTRTEAVSTPGCFLVLALIVGGGITGLMKLFGAGSGWVTGALVVSGLVALFPIVSAVRRLARRPVVHQLVKDGPLASSEPSETPLSEVA